MAADRRRRPGPVVRVLPVLAAGLAVALLAGVPVMPQGMRSLLGLSAGSGQSGSAAPGTGSEAVFFLQAAGFDPAGPRPAVLLHALATGGQPLIVTDPELLSQAAPLAFYTDDRSAETRLVLLSILFLSPPSAPTSQPFATLFQDGREIATLTCFVRHCRDADVARSRDLAGLLQAGQPAEQVDEHVTGTAAIQARATALAAGPDVWVTSGLPLALPGEPGSHGASALVTLPAMLLLPGQERDFDAPAWLDRLAAETLERLTDAGIAAELRRADLRETWHSVPLGAAGGRPAPTDADGYPLRLGDFTELRPQLELWIAPGDTAPARALLAPWLAELPGLDWPDAETLRALILERYPARDITGLEVVRPDFLDPAPGVSGPIEPAVTFSYYRLAGPADEPALPQ